MGIMDRFFKKHERDVDMLVTLWPSFPHFAEYARHPSVMGVRLNSAMMSCPELDKELAIASEAWNNLPEGWTDEGRRKFWEAMQTSGTAPLFYDIKGRQPRVIEVLENPNFLDIRLNHPIEVKTPAPIIFKGGMDFGVLGSLEDGGQRLIFQANPMFKVKAGESLCIRAPHRILGDPFTEAEREKIAKVRAAGFTRYFLSYVEEQSDVDSFRELVGKDAEIWLKIENERGLRYVREDFVKEDGLVLVAARGDLYVEIDKPHMIHKAMKLIIEKDPRACAASRLLLSVVDKTSDTETLWKYTGDLGETFYLHFRTREGEQPVLSPATGRPVQAPPVKTYLNTMKMTVNPVPSCADFMELQAIYDMGYRCMMLCDELCLRGDLLGTAINAFDAWRSTLEKD